MRVCFDDGSFLDLEESITEGKATTVVLCGIEDRTVTMSSAELDWEQTEALYKKLGEILEKEKKDE